MKNQIATFVLAGALIASPAAGAAAEVKLVVHPSVAGNQIKRETVSAVFLSRMTRWSDGRPIVAVDQSAQSPVRASFSNDVLKQPIPAVQAYWMQQIQSGKSRPPAVKTSDADVIAFVAANPGAIGYVAELPEGAAVKELAVVE